MACWTCRRVSACHVWIVVASELQSWNELVAAKAVGTQAEEHGFGETSVVGLENSVWDPAQ